MPAPARTSPGLRRLTTATAATTLVLIAVGGAVRATDSGLACPTWPGCFTAGDFVPPADLNVWLEHTHRLVAGVVGLLIAAQLLVVLLRHRGERDLLWPAVAAAVAVNVQALLGALVVWNLLRAELVTAHLGLGSAVLALQLWMAVAARRGPVPVDGRRAGWRPAARSMAAVAVLVYVQMLVGAHVSGVGSGLAYVDQPALGVAAVAPITGEGDAFNVAHRVLALVVAGVVMDLLRRLRRTEGLESTPVRLVRAATWLVVVQIALGVANLASDLSFVTVIPHLAVASWMWSVLLVAAFLLQRPRVPSPRPAGAEVADRMGELVR